ncbi:hypothetical protein AB0G02_17175 [Actinosynnema sp. NPDC023658]|uniref:RCC1 domain-containing protein n=1 Tax=Actinosynnema sp. NPDC023658 TaxID=3155465 RepID=UPI0034116A8C
MFKRFVLPAVAMLVLSLSAAAPTAAAAVSTASSYTPVTPVRVLDTRAALGAPAGVVGAGQTVVLDLSARTPAGTTAVVLNVTATEPTASTYVTVWPSETTRPATSNLNVVAGETRPNLVTVRLGQSRKVSLFNATGTVHLLADLAGYYAPGTGSLYQPVPPRRALDTRDGTGAGTRNPDGSLALNLTGVVPAEASAVTFNLTATNVTADTYVTAWPHGKTRPSASNLNLVPGDTRANLVTVALGTDRTVDLYTRQGTVDLIADVAGFYVPGEGLAFHAMDPVRVADTRSSAAARPDQPLELLLAMDLSIPTTATAVMLNVTATEATAATYVSVVPGNGAPAAASSALNVTAGATVPNLVSVVAGMYGALVLKPGTGSVQLIVDLGGYFAPAPSTCATGCVQAWGQSNNGVLGSGGGAGGNAYFGEAGARPVSSLDGATALAGRYALRSDGTVWAWGENSSGELGAGWHVGGGFAPVPVKVRGLTGVTAIAASASNGYALRTDGTVWGWGANSAKQVGPDTSADHVVDLPVRIQGVDNAVAVAASAGTAYAVRSDGTVWAWGNNSSGELGTGTAGGSSATAVQVAGLTGVKAIAAGGGSRYALRTDGTVWTWGSNAEGQLGNGTATGRTATATPVAGLTGVLSVAAASTTGFAVQADRTVVAWGSHAQGTAGVGATGEQYVTRPKAVQGLSQVRTVVGAGGNGYALLEDGSTWGWGANAWYQLGVQDVASSPTPVRVPSLPSAAAIAATGTSAYAIAR